MGKQKRRIPSPGNKSKNKVLQKNVEIAPNFKESSDNLFQDALAISKAGAFAIVIECVVESLARKITKNISVPTIGIGASKYCDGQILVIDDMLGLSDFSPSFVKKYSDLRKIIDRSIKNYAKDVKARRFPSTKNVHK